MKKIICLMFVALTVSFSLITAFAHPGSLDSNGGHWNHKTGEYHYHDGNNDGSDSSGSSRLTYDYDYGNHNKKQSKDDVSFSLFKKISVSYIWGAWDIAHLVLTFIVIGAYFYVFSNDLKNKISTSIIGLVTNALALITFSLSLDFVSASGETLVNTCVLGFVGTTMGSVFSLILILSIIERLNDFIQFWR